MSTNGSLQGMFIAATPALKEDYFGGSVIFIHAHNANGASGFIINRQYPRSLNELEEFIDASPITIYEGGPVDQEHLFFLHRAGDIISGGEHVNDDICFGGDFTKAVQMLSNGQRSSDEIKVFIGYCGWDAGELEAEIAEGSWIITSLPSSAVFNAQPLP